MNVRVRCYARIRDVVGSESVVRSFPANATAADCFASLANEFPELASLRGVTRFVRGSAFVAGDAPLCDGDELGLLPPYGGG